MISVYGVAYTDSLCSTFLPSFICELIKQTILKWNKEVFIQRQPSLPFIVFSEVFQAISDGDLGLAQERASP